MGFSGMKTDQARDLAAALDVAGGALSIQGDAIRRLLERWDGDTSRLASFPSRASWAQDQAKDIRRRVGLLEQDPEGVLMFASMAGLLDTWLSIKDSPLYQRYEQIQQIKKDVTTPLQVLKIPTAIEAALHLYKRWDQGRNVAAARALLEFSRWWGDADRIKAHRKELLRELLKAQRIRNWYKEPWKWQQAVRSVAQRLRIPKADKLFTKAPGTGFLAQRVLLPANIVTGLKEAISPTHDGARGWVDRGMGLLQAAGAGAVLGGASVATALGASATVAAAVPVAGWVALGVAGTYFLGSWVWDKWGDDIKKGAGAAADWARDKAGKALESTKNFAKKFKFW
ncbi:hypothetical protein [Thermopolyspora flexuosa]|jgi:hypothetical protein|uniref:Uncharacterized protein n=1 Tax=Thermopolyspora flexuosa TaxID=103836 RepID=A0A543IZ14_9ACTN|nr:hypothetical protein [Thermopolyspora flexuosa]TQM75820.1 hypothetical protein FHX40_2540 [Thermopolyspora flexuosa]